jgi:hypothetical protein
MATSMRNQQPIGFTESERPDYTRYASFNTDGTVRLNLRGLAPKNEQDADTVCGILVTALNARGQQAGLKGRGEQDEDWVLVVNGTRVGAQVVRALTDPRFWMNLARTGEVGELQLSISEAASALKKAIEHKAAIPPEQRTKLILVLDAYRLPALALGSVTDQFKRIYATWVQSLGFYAIYVVGPEPNFVSRLDEQFAQNMRTRPTGIFIIGLFLLVAPVILVVSAISLLVPRTFLDQIWVVNETGYQQLLPVRGFVGIGFLALGVVIALAGTGLLKGRKWGWWLALLVFAANGIGDAVRFRSGDFLGGSIGLVVVAVILFYLTRPKVRDFFKESQT